MSSRCLVTFNFNNNFELSTWCDVLPMKVAHIVLGTPWLFDERVQHNGYENTYTLVHNGPKKILRPMKEIPPIKQPKEKLASLKSEESSNEECGKQLSTSLLMTYNYFENYQLVLQYWEVFQSLIFVLHEVEEIQQILIFCLVMVISRRKKKRGVRHCLEFQLILEDH